MDDMYIHILAGEKHDEVHIVLIDDTLILHISPVYEHWALHIIIDKYFPTRYRNISKLASLMLKYDGFDVLCYLHTVLSLKLDAEGEHMSSRKASQLTSNIHYIERIMKEYG